MLRLTLISLALAWAVFQAGGVVPFHWRIATLVISLVALFSLRGPSLPKTLLWSALLLPAYALFQLIPLPLAVLKLISPARAAQLEATQKLVPGLSTAPLSVKPAATLEFFLVIAACTLAFLILRKIAWDHANRLWLLAAPLVIIASLEAILGLFQFYLTGGQIPAHGTYVNRNHFAGLLEMTLPFALMYSVAVLRRHRSRWSSPLRPALLACAGFSVAALLLLGTLHSLSRMGFTCAIFSVLLCGVLCVSVVKKVFLVAALAALLFVFLPSDQLIERFGSLDFSDGLTRQDRLDLWRETLPLIAAYPIFGCGLGGYESAFMPHKISGPLLTDDYAHNDYLQSLAELGLAGFLIVATLIAAVLFQGIRATVRHATPDGRALATACVASIAAILLHSTVDFNLYIPANALVLAWISAIATAAMFSSASIPAANPQLPQVLETTCAP
ncbi:MAG: O-antigen ligase family protein [Bryobacteraceae bacterium]|jgi:O-antigen ligase